MIDPTQWRIDCAEHPKGQRVSMNPSGVTVTHLPSGTAATVDISSQHMNRHIAMEMVEWALTYDKRPQSKQAAK
jgi:protein subunit release factor A